MPKSNVRSAEYRAAGGRAWNRVKTGKRGVFWDGPETEHKIARRHDKQVESDTYQANKDWYRKGKADALAGTESEVPEHAMDQYYAGVAYGEYLLNNGEV